MKKTLAGFVLVMLLAASGSAATITIVADEWCPYNCEPDDEQPGFMIEAARTILGAAGHDVAYVMLDDWDQAIEEARAGNYTAIVGAFKDDAPDFIFPDERMGIAENFLFVRKGDTWKFDGYESLAGKQVVGITAYSYGEEMDEWMEQNGTYVSSLEEAVEALLGGTADALIENEYVMQLFAMRNHILGELVSAGSVNMAAEDDYVYVAFSPALPESEEYAKILSEGLRRMKSEGSWKTLMQQYGLEYK